MIDTLPVMGRPTKDKTENARISISIMRKVRVIAAHLDQSAPDFLNEVLQPIIDKKYADIIAKAAKEQSKRDS